MNKKLSDKKRLDLLCYNKQLLFRWIRRNQMGRPITNFFQENHLKQVALYYWNEMSELLYYELVHADIEVAGVIDERPGLEISLSVYETVKDVPDVDAIIICTAMNTAMIEEELRRQRKCLIFTVDDIL